EVPGSLRELRSLHYLEVSGNSILELPPSLGELPDLWGLGVQDNPLAPEVLAAAEEGTDALLEFLRLLQTDGERIHECKLILVGEGAAGKSSLLAALRGEPWVENRDTTHGIQIKPVQVEHDGQEIALNGWDFGGQAIYRPTHQLFFTHPAVYLVVWK